VDDTVLYCSAPSLTSAIEDLQSAFILKNLHELRPVQNSDKTKMMSFSKSRKTEDACQIVTDEKVNEYQSIYILVSFLKTS